MKEALREIVAVVEAFDRECAEAEYTELDEAWDVLRDVLKLAKEALGDQSDDEESKRLRKALGIS